MNVQHQVLVDVEEIKATKLGELAQNLFEKQLDLYSLSLTLLFE